MEVSSQTVAAGLWEPRFVNDGITDSSTGAVGWTSRVGKYLDNEDYNEWVMIDLGEERNVSAVFLWPREDGGNEGIYFPVDYHIEVSGDKENWTTVYSMEGDEGAFDFDYSPRKIFLENVKGRYVKVVGTELTDANAVHAAADGPLMQLGEFEIYSKD